MQIVNYSYDVKIGNNSAVFELNGIWGAIAPDASEIDIASRLFPHYEECENALYRLLNKLSTDESYLAEAGHVIVIKRNPQIFNSKSDEEKWDEATLIKFFIADSDELKKSILDYNIEARIRMFSIDISSTDITIAQLQ